MSPSDVVDATETSIEGAFTALYEEHYRTLRVVASMHAGDALADDVVQEAAITAMRRFDSFEPGTDFRAWMSAIVRNTARNHRRSERRRAARRERIAHSGTSGSGDSGGTKNGAGGGGMDHVFDAALERAMETLSDVQRACLVLRVVLDHTYDQIATILDMPAATARSHVHRARAVLADRLRLFAGPDSEGVTP